MTSRGVVRLLNTSGGRALCLAGAIDGRAVQDFHARYGREPARIDRIDAGSVTALSPSGLDLLREHLEAARRSGRSVELSCAPLVERLLGDAAPEGR
jgi:ABC-type transporter Mla MlaB component